MKNPKIPFEGWTIEYDNKNHEYKNIALHLEPEQKESYIKGEVMAERLKEKGLNASVFDYFFENQDMIPQDWKGKYVYFWGTIFRNSDGIRFVLCLYWNDGEWHCRYDWLRSRWDVSNPSAVLASSTVPLETKNSFENLTLEKAQEIVKQAGFKIFKEL